MSFSRALAFLVAAPVLSLALLAAHAQESGMTLTERTIDGAQARAVAQAYAGFVKAQPDAAVGNYEVLIKQDDAHFVVVFLPKLAEGERPARGGGTSLGREWTAWISREDFSLIRQAFAR